MDIGSSFTYMFEDENWIKKILIGSIVAIIPIVNFAAFGYLVQVIRNVRDGQPLPLPEWDQFGQYFVDGLWLFLIFLIWMIPIIALACIQGIGTAALSDNNEDLVGILSICFGCLNLLWALVFGVVYPAILIRFAEVGEFRAGFQFSEIFGLIGSNLGSYIIVLILIWVAQGIIAPLGVIVCIIGVIFTQFWAYLVSGNLMGQLAAQSQPTETAAV